MAGMTSIVPWLSVGDATAAVDFYRRAFGAEPVEQLDDEGVVVVARLRLDDAEFWIQADDDPPGGDRHRFARMIVAVSDPDQRFGRALASGATEVAGMHDEHGWRTGRLADPFGHEWEFARVSPA
jgi:PhnB protein